MKQPSKEELEQLSRWRNDKHAVRYFERLESEYIKRLIGCDETATIHRLQGSIETIQALLKYITSETR